MCKADKEIHVRKIESMGWHVRDDVLYIMILKRIMNWNQYSSMAVLTLGFKHSRSNEDKKKPAIHLNIDCCTCCNQ